MYQNTVYHHCALHGTRRIWDLLVIAKILEDEHNLREAEGKPWTKADRLAMKGELHRTSLEKPDEPDDDTNEDEENRYRAESWIRKQYNRASMNPLQFACFVNNRPVFDKII